jgi:LCP family protein required for cell wall assembly
VPHSSRLRRIATWLSLFIVVSSLASWGLSTKYTGAMKKVNVFGNLKESDRPQVTNTDAMTILAVAVDDRSGLTRKQLNELHVGHANYGPPRTDTIMLIHIAPAGGGVTVVSMPRDSWIAIPEYTDTKGNPHAATHDRINTLYQRGGPELMVKTIEQLTNMRIDHFVELNFFGFLNMVDAVGGVPMCISKDVKDTDSGLDLTAGNHVLTGRQALAYVRARHIDSDFGRMQRQQRFLSSMAQRVMSAGVILNPAKLNGFINAAMQSLTTDDGLNRDALLNLALRAQSLGLSKLRFMTVPIGDGNANVSGMSVVLWDETQARTLFAKLAANEPVVTAATTSELAVAPGEITLSVLNATSITGLARKAADSLASVGFGFASAPGNALKKDAVVTYIQYPKDQAEAAKTVAASLPFAKLKETTDVKNIRILVGTDWKDAKAVKAGNTSTTAIVKTVTDPRTAADSICE